MYKILRWCSFLDFGKSKKKKLQRTTKRLKKLKEKKIRLKRRRIAVDSDEERSLMGLDDDENDSNKVVALKGFLHISYQKAEKHQH